MYSAHPHSHPSTPLSPVPTSTHRPTPPSLQPPSSAARMRLRGTPRGRAHHPLPVGTVVDGLPISHSLYDPIYYKDQLGMPPPYLPNHVLPTSSHPPRERGYYEREIVAGYPDGRGDLPNPNSSSNPNPNRNPNRNHSRTSNRTRTHPQPQPQSPPSVTAMPSPATVRTRPSRTHTRSPVEETDSYQYTGTLPDGREFSVDHRQPYKLTQEEKQRISLRRDERREHYHPVPMPPHALPTNFEEYRSERVPHSEASRYGVPTITTTTIPSPPSYPPQPDQEQLPLNSRSRRDEHFEREGNHHHHHHYHHYHHWGWS